ncbi:MAG: tetratricopeptide repeat protein [Muribaculaceae bacterium]
MIRLIAIIILCLGLAGCGGSAHDARLSRIADSLDANPHGALAALDSIDASRLSEADRHYYDLLTVKSRDKAYVTHTSDSLILSVMQYYEHHDTDHYPEALYYGGRVYSDLGDFPTALRYFQDALSVTPIDKDIHLRGNILSQCGRLLSSINLKSSAINYIKEAIHIDSIENNLFNLAYDNELLGHIYMNRSEYDQAFIYFSKAKHYADYLVSEDQANMQMYLAAVYLKRDMIDSAMFYIKDLPSKVPTNCRNICLKFAADTYLKAGILDTAYLYAKELAFSNNPNNRKSGYQILLSDEMSDYIPEDSLRWYIYNYRKTLKNFYDGQSSRGALVQNAFYNYQLHERAKNEVERKNTLLISYICILFCLVLICFISILIFRYRRNKTLLELHRSKDAIERLKQIISDEKISIKESNPVHHGNIGSMELREQLKKELESLNETGLVVELPHQLTSSETYCNLQNYIKQERIISEYPAFWVELEEIVKLNFPDFKKRLEILLGGNIKEHELQTVLLIKCGLNTKQMMILLGRTKTAISERRKNLSNRILGQKSTSSYIDAIIRLL